MLQKILKNKLYLGLAIGGIAVIIAAIILTCVFACGGNKNNNASADTVEQHIFEFEVSMGEDDEVYPVTFISASDFYETIESNSDYTDSLILEDKMENTEAAIHSLTYIEMSGTDFISSRNGTYLEVGSLIYDVNYTNCDFFNFDIDNDGEEELIFYTCEILNSGIKQVCTYYIIDGEETYWCRYNRAWAIGTEMPVVSDTDVSGSDVSGTDVNAVEVVVDEENAFFVSLMIVGVEHEVYGGLVCDNSGEVPYYYIDAGDYTDLLQRLDGLDK